MRRFVHRGWLVLAMAVAFCLAGGPARAESTAPRQNPYDRQFKILAARFTASQSAPEQAVLLARVVRLREFVDDRSAVEGFIDRVAADSAVDRLVRDEALRDLADLDVHHARLDDAERRYEQLGFVRQWSIVGPFPSTAGLTGDFGPEQGFRPGESYRDALGNQLSWRATAASGPRMSVDLADYYAHAGAAVAFAAASVYAPEARPVALRFTAESAFTLWVNGSEATSDAAPHGIAFDQHAVGVELHQGWNTLLLKFARDGEGAWRFALRITAPAGGGLALQSSSTRPFGAPAAAPGAMRIADLVEAARSAVAEPVAGVSPAARQFLLGEIELDHAGGTALEDMETAARREPTAERWLAIAHTTDDESYRFAALTAAIAADAHNAEAKSELGAYYFSRGQFEKARDLLREAIRLAPDDLVARKRFADVLAAADLPSVALAEYAALEAEFPAPLWVKRAVAPRYEAAGIASKARSLASAVVAQEFDAADMRALLVRLAERDGDIDTLVKHYTAAAALDPASTLPVERLARLEHGGGSVAAAESAPAKALTLASARVRQSLVAATHGASPSSDAEYLVDSAALAANAHRHPPGDAAAAVVLADVRVERMMPNGLTSARVQQVYYVGSDAAAHDFRSRSLQYAPGTHDLRILHARVYKRDGRVVDGEDAGENAVSDPAVAMYYDARTRLVRFHSVEPGDVVEIDYQLSPATKVNPYGDYFGEMMVFRSELPQRLKRFVLIAPAARPLSVAEQRMPSPGRVEVRGGERVYRWEARDVAALAAEPRGPAIAEIAPYVHVSTFASWAELGRWYAQLIAPQFTLDAALRAELQRLLAGRHSDLEKIRAIDHFVLRNTHYVALEFGIYGYKPYPVSQTYARRYGDCKDKASLMIALLRAAGIDAEIALVRTRSLGALDDAPASIAVFNHAVAYLPKFQMWLDGTAEYAGSQELPIDDQGATALTVAADGRAAIRHIPVSSPLDNFSRRVVTAQVAPDGTVKFSGNVTTRGEDAPGLRRSYEIPERRRDAFATRLAEVLPAVHIEDVNIDDANDLERDVTVNFRGTFDQYRGRNTVSLATSWTPHAWVETLAPLASRTEDLLLSAPWTAEEQVRFELPSGASVASIPADRKLESEFGTATLRFERRGRVLLVNSSVQFRKLRVTPAEYASFRAFCADVERAFREEIKVSLGG